jgi:hypothetical protein
MMDAPEREQALRARADAFLPPDGADRCASATSTASTSR